MVLRSWARRAAFARSAIRNPLQIDIEPLSRPQQTSYVPHFHTFAHLLKSLASRQQHASHDCKTDAARVNRHQSGGSEGLRYSSTFRNSADCNTGLAASGRRTPPTALMRVPQQSDPSAPARSYTCCGAVPSTTRCVRFVISTSARLESPSTMQLFAISFDRHAAPDRSRDTACSFPQHDEGRARRTGRKPASGESAGRLDELDIEPLASDS